MPELYIALLILTIACGMTVLILTALRTRRLVLYAMIFVGAATTTGVLAWAREDSVALGWALIGFWVVILLFTFAIQAYQRVREQKKALSRYRL